MPRTDEIPFAKLDSRKRINLATIATTDTYKVTREPSGRIILEPVVLVTEQELVSLRQNPND